MLQSDVARLVASRPSGAAIASLFSDGSETLSIVQQPRCGRRAPSVRSLARRIVLRACDALLSQVPCEDIVSDTMPAAYFIRRRIHA